LVLVEANVESQRASSDAVAKERMSGGMRVLIFFTFPVCLLPIGVLIYYYRTGHTGKVRDWWVTVGISIALYIVIGVLVSVVFNPGGL
jgi:hypothetical protein